jgi:hypothetical protein
MRTLLVSHNLLYEYDIIVRKTDHILDTLNITPESVEKKLDKLKTSKSPGPDNIHPRVLKELRTVISAPLAHIFRTSVNTGQIPEEWKCANITAIFKKGDRKVAGNYRPISLTCITCTV